MYLLGTTPPAPSDMRIGIAIVGEPLPTRTTRPAFLMKTREPRHLRTPTTGLAMGQDPRNREGDPPPHPTKEPTSRESSCLPVRHRSIDSRRAALRGPPSSPEPSRPTVSSPRSDSRRLPVFRLKRLDKSLPEDLLPEELDDSSEEYSDPSQPIPKRRALCCRRRTALM